MTVKSQHPLSGLPRFNRKEARLGSYYIRGCLQGAVQNGYDPLEILESAKIDPSVYSDPDATIDGEQLQRLIIAINNIMNDEYMGFLDVQGKLEMGYLVSLAAVKSDTLHHALSRMVEFINAVRNDIQMECTVEKDEVSLISRITGLSDAVEPHLIVWFKMYWGYKFNCWLIGQRIKLTRVCFSSARPEQSIDYNQLFNCSVEFGRKSDRICFDREYMSLPVIRNEVELFERAFIKEYSNWFAIPGKDQTLSSQVEQLLLDLYSQDRNTPTLQVLANTLCISPRTISRRLHKENVTFQGIKDKVRCELAQKLLLETDASVAQIAGKVGFWEPADFTRAYVRWTDQTPSEFRAKNRT